MTLKKIMGQSSKNKVEKAGIAKLIHKIGGKITPQRSEILRVLKLSEKPICAKEIFEHVKKSQPNISIDTIYRNLDMLTTSGLVCQMNVRHSGKSFFEFIGEHHHHHAICTMCGSIECVDICFPIENISLKKDKKFKITGHVFELYGICGVCQNE